MDQMPPADLAPLSARAPWRATRASVSAAGRGAERLIASNRASYATDRVLTPAIRFDCLISMFNPL